MTDWTVEELARHAGTSRSAFALRSRKPFARSRWEYLTRWRMLLAGGRMADTSDFISEVAWSRGYEFLQRYKLIEFPPLREQTL